MSHKSELDKAREGYPFTARQKRMKISKRLQRKSVRKALRWKA